MRTAKRRKRAGLIQRLLDQPHQFDFFQAVHLFELWLARHGVARETALSTYLRFENSVTLGFPASQIEALRADTVDQADATSEAGLLAALRDGRLSHIAITPAFIGFLGEHGVLPTHYTERIARHQRDSRSDAARAFLDAFSNRIVALFYRAWAKYRLELARAADGRHGLLELLLALSGGARHDVDRHGLPQEVQAYYAGVLGQCPAAAVVIERVLTDYFGVPFALEQQRGYWQGLAPAMQAQLGGENACLGVRCLAAERTWRRDLRCGLRIGPLEREQFLRFLPGSPASAELHQLLRMFAVPTQSFEVSLVLRSQAVRGSALGAGLGGTPGGAIGARLGMESFMIDGAAPDDRDDVRYLLSAF